VFSKSKPASIVTQSYDSIVTRTGVTIKTSVGLDDWIYCFAFLPFHLTSYIPHEFVLLGVLTSNVV
jgi:hypothetical protein